MQLTRVRLSGFKSFVDPVELRILPGLTGIVGPNGCGKSNLLEAIRWAMGEGSPKSLRGAAMDDVIFAGTATRPARQFAEVAICAERGSDAGGDETEVVRRIERGAGSAYRIDGRDSRARDAQLLFADAATGAHSPALVSQGRIGAVIAAKPAERRTMLEEAAGIAGLHVRRREAEARLKATETNLARVGEVVADMDVRANGLHRQARIAERYLRVCDAIRVAEARLVYARWRDAAAAADVARAESVAAETTVAAAGEAQRVATALARDAAQRLSKARAGAQTARDIAAEARHALATAEAALRTIERRRIELAAERDRLDTDRSRESDLAIDAADALARLSDESTLLAARIAEADARRDGEAATVLRVETEARDAEVTLAQANAVAAEHAAERRIADAALVAAAQRVDRANRERARIAQLAAALVKVAAIDARLVEAEAARDAASAGVEAAIAALAAADVAREHAAATLAGAQVVHAAAAAACSGLDSEARVLIPARESTGALARVSAAPGYEIALAAALADDLGAAVGDSDAPRRWGGSAIALSDPVLDMGTPLAAHVVAPPELARRLAQIAVVEADDGAMLAVGQRLVTRRGVVRRWDGFVSSGTGALEAERLARRNRLVEVETLLVDARAAASAADAALMDARGGVTATTRALAEARVARDASETRLRTALRTVDATLAERERVEAAHAEHGALCARAEAEVTAARADQAAAIARRASLPANDASALLTLRAREAHAARDAVAAARTSLASLDAQRDNDAARHAAALIEAEGWRTRGGKAAKRTADMARRSATLDIEAETLADAPAVAEADIVAARATASDTAGAAEAALAAERTAERDGQDCDVAVTLAGEALASAREARAGAVARAENQELRRIEMGRVSGERFECPPPLLPERLGFEAGGVAGAQCESARLDSLTADRERLGPVNLVAASELAELEAARNANAAEIAELTEATHRLRGSIGSLNREGRTKLRAAFEAVDGHFRALFRTLFDGGEAHLELIDSDDPLDAGLEIMAQPPGKKLASLTLLSGGEQALTAVALIFALFLTNPAPLCVLDEVDAPLDDANVERFCDLLDAMNRDTDTRYLIVTHNAVTMARMDRLYGVTMVEAGISRLVSVDLGSAVDLITAG